MLYNRIYIQSPVLYNSTGTFHAPSTEWIHDKRETPNFELIIMISGTLYLEVESIRYTVSPNQYMLIQPSDHRNSRNYTKLKGYRPSNCTYYWMHFDAPYHSFCTPTHTDFIPTDHNIYLPTVGTLSSPSRVLQYMRQLQDCMRKEYRNFLDFGNYLATTILCEIYHQFLDSYYVNSEKFNIYIKQEESLSTKNQKLFNDLSDYIKANLSKDLKVQQIADYFGYSSKYLSSICQQNTGYSLKKYIQSLKMDLANFLLLDTNLNIQSIGAELGFLNTQNFSRAYKNYMGISPLEYRNNYSKKINN